MSDLGAREEAWAGHQEGRAEVTETPTETPVFGQVEAETLSLGPSGPGAKTNRGLGGGGRGGGITTVPGVRL